MFSITKYEILNSLGILRVLKKFLALEKGWKWSILFWISLKQLGIISGIKKRKIGQVNSKSQINTQT